MADISKFGRSMVQPTEEILKETPQRRLCPICGKTLCDRSALRKHIIRHDNAHRYQCSICDAKFVEKTHLHEHGRKHTQPKLSCHTCGKKFMHNSSLTRHTSQCKENHVDQHQCVVCPLTFTRRDSLLMHMAAIHQSKCKYHCKDCGKQFKWRSSLRSHRRSKHSG